MEIEDLVPILINSYSVQQEKVLNDMIRNGTGVYC